MTDASRIQELQERLDRMEHRVGEAEDRDAIYRLLIDLQDSMDQRDLVKYGSFYTEDGEWCAISGRAIGPARITEFLRQYCKPWESEAQRSYHSISDVSIDVNGDKATARGQWRHDHPGDKGQPVTRHFGRFEAMLQRTPDGWRIRRRASYGILPYSEPKYQLTGKTEAEEWLKLPGENRPKTRSGAATIEELQERLGRAEHSLKEVEDRDAIYRLFIRLQDATDGQDAVKYGQCFMQEDGEWSGVSGRAVGRAAITDYMARFFKPWESQAQRTYHSISDVSIDLDGDMATAQVRYRHIKLDDDGMPAAFHLGHFDAIVQRTPNGWRFNRRAGYVDLPYFEPKYQLIGPAASDARK